MNVNVRLSAGFAQTTGTTRLVVDLADGATIADLLGQLRASYPAMEAKLQAAVPTVAGRHVSPTQLLSAGQEVALLLPVAGG
jgi:molybdopterin converting factor small subunit